MDIHDLRRAVCYDAESGLMTWTPKVGVGKEIKRWNSRYAGTSAFATVSDSGYLTGTINGKHVKAHRAAWAIFHGYWPEMAIDHVNGNPSDNRICNLREATRAQNAQNLRKRQGGLSIYRGVSKDRDRWRANINANGKRLCLGSFNTEEKAAIAYDLAVPLMHGEFARPNIVHDREAITAFVDEYARKHHKEKTIAGVTVWTEKEAF